MFRAKKAGEKGLSMRMYMNGAENRSYATVMAPPAKLNSVAYYIKKDTPTIVVRKEGDAWEQPFAAVYEACEGLDGKGSVREVKTLEQDGVFKGLRVDSVVNGKRSRQGALSFSGARVIRGM